MRARLHRNALGVCAWKSLVPLAALLLSACGDPAPGEGMAKAPMSNPSPEIVSAREAVNTPDIPTIDPQTLDAAEIGKVLAAGRVCSFAYTAESPPVVALRMASDETGQGVVKIHGRLVQLVASRAESGSFLLKADGMRLGIDLPSADEGRGGEPREADLHFELEQGLRVGYHGWYRCTGSES